MINFFKKNQVLIFAILIFSLALFLRTYRLPDTYIFNFDEEYQSTYAWTEVSDPHPIWIGVSSSFLDFYLGPYFTYFTAVLLKISHGDPLFTAYFAALSGSITAVVLFLVGRKVFNLKTGIISGFLYASLPLFVFFDQKYWNTMFTPVIAVLLFLTAYLVKKNAWFWVLYSALFGIILETHLEPAPLLLIGIWYFFKDKYWKNLKLVLVCLLVFLLFYWPLIVFDFNHNFSNITIFSRFGKGVSESKVTFDPTAKFRTLLDSAGRYWYLKPGNPNADEINFGCTSLSVKQELKFIDQYAKRTYAPIYLSLLTLTLLLIFLGLSFKSKSREMKLLSVFLILSLVAFMAFPGGSSEYYTLSFLVLFTFVPGILISKLDKKYTPFLLILISLPILLGIKTVMNASDEFSLEPKKKIISEVMNAVGNNSFSIEGRGVCHDYEGWRYLFKAYGRVPSMSYTDKNLGWLYPKEIDTTPTAFTIILSEDRIPLKEDLSKLPSVKEGGYRAYIKKNTI